jgi:HSP20 family protein
MANRDLSPWRRRHEMDRLFDDFFAPAEGRSFAPAGRGAAQSMVTPSLDVEETEQAYTVTAELPGIDQKDVDLRLDENALTISGEKRSERKEEDGERRYSERSFGRFERTIPFAAEIDADRVEANFENGVLRITLPKNARAHDKTRRIQIGGSASGKAAGAPPSGKS